MRRSDEPIEPMTLGNMRRNGVRSPYATCQHCGHRTVVNVDAHPDDVTVPSFGPRMRCTTAASSAPPRSRTGSSRGMACLGDGASCTMSPIAKSEAGAAARFILCITASGSR